MNNELMRYSNGTTPVPKQDRDVAVGAKAIYDYARVTAMKADAVMAVGSHLMEGITKIHKVRLSLASDDDSLNMALGEVEAQVFRDCMSIQRNMFGWGS